MATQVISNHHQHHVTFSGSSQALPRHVMSPGPTTSMSANGFTFNGFDPSSSRNASLSVEHDNPFRPGSELIEEAESILKSVTIVGSHVTISGNDSGIGALSPNRANERSPATSGSASQVNETHQLSAISTTMMSPVGGGQLRVENADSDIVQRASPDSIRPESPPMRAEHVLVSKGHVSPKPTPEPAEPSNPFNDPQLQAAALEPIPEKDSCGKKGKKDKKCKDKKKKKCSVL